MMTVNEAYYIARGLAYQLGCDDFDAAMPSERAKSFLRGFLGAKGFAAFNNDGAKALALAACRLERINKRPCPPDWSRCKWRKSMQQEFHSTPRKTAFRIEVVCPQDRCAYDIKDGHIGGSFFDYELCHKAAN